VARVAQGLQAFAAWQEWPTIGHIVDVVDICGWDQLAIVLAAVAEWEPFKVEHPELLPAVSVNLMFLEAMREHG
jgi:hypothetical protein